MLQHLFPQTRRRLLALLLLHPDREFHLREIVRCVESGRGAVERELGNLLEAGIRRMSRRGNLTLYVADRSCPVYGELRGLVTKTDGLRDIILQALEVVKGIKLALIFGSTASGKADGLSDVDVMIVGDVRFGDISSALLPAQKLLAREIAPTVYSPEEFTSRLREGHHFLKRVLAGPLVFLKGDLNDFEGMDGSS
jgi:predicted nucleotidyltransferase